MKIQLKRIAYLLILVLLPCGGITIVVNAQSHSKPESNKLQLKSIISEDGKKGNVINSGGIHSDDPQ